MNILSYRGPLAGGGVAAALSSLSCNFAQDIEHWWHIYDGRVEDSAKSNFKNNNSQVLNEPNQSQFSIKKNILDGHYRYCNNFLWPIMHDMPELADYNKTDHSNYKRFNFSFATNIIQNNSGNSLSSCFIQDYQLALIPRILNVYSKTKHRVFWHIPWPKVVHPDHLPMIKELAGSLLHSEILGFHTAEYAENFLGFARKHLPEYHTDFQKMEIFLRHKNKFHWRLRLADEKEQENDPTTHLLVAPLGLDLNFWNMGNQERSSTNTHPNLLQHPQLEALNTLPFILSVDRADYTKGVFPRLEAIRHFFLVSPEQIGRLSFVLVCQRTRPGLLHFDNYWHQCRELAAVINSELGSENWVPIIWITDNISQEALMELYRRARAMMVTPIRDGLNLTAKEYVASLDDNPGTLLLSPGAGAWVELGNLCLEANPHNPQQMATTILESLSIPLSERQMRAHLMKMTLNKQTLQNWWECFQYTGSSIHSHTAADEQGNSKILEAIGF